MLYDYGGRGNECGRKSRRTHLRRNFSISSIILLRASPKQIGLLEPPSLKSTAKSTRPESFKQVLVPLLRTKALWLLILLALEVYGVCQFFFIYTWNYALESYCRGDYNTVDSECEGTANARLAALGVSFLFPLCGIFAALFVGFLKDKIQTRHRCLLLTCFVSGFLLLLLAMRFLFYRSTLPVAIIVVCCCGFMIMGPYSLISGAFAIDVGGKYRSATVTGILDGVGFLSQSIVILVSFFYGSQSVATFTLLILFTFAALLTSLALWKVDLMQKQTVIDPLSSLDDFLSAEEEQSEHAFILGDGFRRTSVQNSSSEAGSDS